VDTKFLLGSLKGRDHLKDLGVVGRIILYGSLRNRAEKCGLDSSDSG
jgi:hypothetical protein